MMNGKNLNRYYLLLAGCCVMAGLYYLVITLPLIRQERDLDATMREATALLAAAGHGMSREEVNDRIETLKADIERFSTIGRDPARKIQFPPEIEEMLTRPLQLIDFNYRKFLVIDRIRRLSNERDVNMPANWEQRLPSPGRHNAQYLWAQLVAADQVIRTAIEAGVGSIDMLEMISPDQDTSAAQELEVGVRMRLTGSMHAIQSLLVTLPLDAENLQALGKGVSVEPKSAFFADRFILKKSSADNPDEVTLDFVTSGFLQTNSSG